MEAFGRALVKSLHDRRQFGCLRALPAFVFRRLLTGNEPSISIEEYSTLYGRDGGSNLLQLQLAGSDELEALCLTFEGLKAGGDKVRACLACILLFGRFHCKPVLTDLSCSCPRALADCCDFVQRG